MGLLIVFSIHWNPSLVDTNGTYLFIQYTVEPSLVDTNGTYHCVQCSEVSLPQGLLMYGLDSIGTEGNVLYIITQGCP